MKNTWTCTEDVEGLEKKKKRIGDWMETKKADVLKNLDSKIKQNLKVKQNL